MVGGGFDEWVCSLPEFDAERREKGFFLPAGTRDFLREVFDAHGWLSSAETELHWRLREEALARSGSEAFAADVSRTTSLRPTIEVWRDDDGFLIVSYDGNFQAPVFSAIRDPEALCEIADNLSDHVIDEVWGPWPLCPADGGSTKSKVVAGEAVWYCDRGSHVAARIGEMTGSADHDAR